MSTHSFSEAQATHAAQVVLKLMRERRYFLYQHEKDWVKDPGYALEPEVFQSAIELDRKIRETYRDTATRAEATISDAERELGVVGPELTRNQKVVQCNRYTGGLDICRVYPLTAFAPFAPASVGALRRALLQGMLGGATQDDLTPKQYRGLQEQTQALAAVIWAQLEALEIRDPNNPRCVVVMKTRFYPNGNLDDDFMEGKVLDLQEFPHALGYLFHAYSKQTRIVAHDHVVFSTSRSSHVNVQHWSNERWPKIRYDQGAGYDCHVHFVTVF